MDVASVNGTFTECSEIPPPTGQPIECHHVVPCLGAADGWYRTRVSVLWTAPDGRSGTFSPDERPRGEIRCP